MVDLSIILPVYNHAPYIKQAIDSILMQKVNFTYEVLIGEDCSTDNSCEILAIEFSHFLPRKEYGR